jgi:hypothetical protein
LSRRPSLTIPFSLELIGFAVGRDQVSRLTGTFGGGTVPRGTEQSLSKLLVSRALALPH